MRCIFKIVLSLIVSISSLFAINCGDYGGEFKSYGNHYYAITGNTMDFETAKGFATANGGYLAIPNSSGENSFIKDMIGANSESWIGVYDPNKSTNYCFDTTCTTKYDRSRFQTVLNATLSYSNWDSIDISNLVYSQDSSNIGTSDGTRVLIENPGEYYVLMSGTTGKWRDYGPHYNNPSPKFSAVIEFDTKPTCYETPSNVVEEFSGRKCNTQIKDGEVLSGSASLVDCQTDTKGTEYCPSQMAECAQEWDYENGYSVENIGTAEDYTQKICDGVMINGICYDNSVKDATKVTNLSCVTKSIACAPGASSCCHIDITCSGNSATVKYYDCCPSQGSLKKTVNIADANQFINGVYYQPYTGSQGRVICNSSGACSIYFQDAYCGGSSIGSPYLTNTFTLNTSDSYVCNDSGYVNGSQISADPKKCYKQKALTCPSTHPSVQPDGTCKKSVNYKYYTYVCSDSQTSQGYNYIPQNTGGDCISSKTDPNTSADNSSTLDDACNSSTPPANNCKREKFTCQVSDDRPCALVDNKWQCSPFPCFGMTDFENAGTVQGSNDTNNDGWTEDGNCAGKIYIFSGQDLRCRSWDALYNLSGHACCGGYEDTLWGLVSCKDDEKLLAKKKDAQLCREIGEYCSKKIKLGFAKICVQKKKTYCCFNSKLAKTIVEQGNIQLGRNFGSAESPNCQGFQVQDFEKLDFSKMDFTDAFDLPSSSDINGIISGLKNLGNNISK